MTTLETIRTAGKAITEAETELLLNKYVKSYMATKALLEVFHQVGRCKMKKSKSVLCVLCTFTPS